MLKYACRRHQKFMDASSFALQDAAESSSEREARIARQVLDDPRKYHCWELGHADLLLPAARHGTAKRQLLELRRAEVQLVHRRALFRYLRDHEIRGRRRIELFRLHHRTLDIEAAILAEHRQYVLAESSHISTDHLIDIMADAAGQRLIGQYETLYGRYFELKCYVATSRDRNCTAMVKPILADVQRQLERVRQRLMTETATAGGTSFERQEALARSGRYEAINYMVG